MLDLTSVSVLFMATYYLDGFLKIVKIMSVKWGVSLTP